MRRQLFTGASTLEFEQLLLKRLRAQIGAAQIVFEELDERFIERTITEFVKQNHLLEPAISLPTDGFQPASTTERVVRNDGRLSRLGTPFSQRMLDFTFLIPISGDPNLLYLSPNTALLGAGIVGTLVLRDDHISYVYTADANVSKDQLAQAIKNDLTSLQRHATAIAGWVQQWNGQLGARIRPMVVQRLGELQRNASLKDGLRIEF